MFEDFNKDSRKNDVEKYESLIRSKESLNYLLKKFMGLKEFVNMQTTFSLIAGYEEIISDNG